MEDEREGNGGEEDREREREKEETRDKWRRKRVPLTSSRFHHYDYIRHVFQSPERSFLDDFFHHSKLFSLIFSFQVMTFSETGKL